MRMKLCSEGEPSACPAGCLRASQRGGECSALLGEFFGDEDTSARWNRIRLFSSGLGTVFRGICL